MYLIWRGLRRSDTFGFCSGSRSVVCGWKVGIVNGRNRAVVLLEQDQYQTGSALHLHETYWYSSIDTYPQNLIYRGTLSPQLRPRESSRTQRLPLVPVRCAVPSIPVHHRYDAFVEQLPWHSAFQPTSPLKILQCRNSRGPCKPSPADGRTHAHPLMCYIIQTFCHYRHGTFENFARATLGVSKLAFTSSPPPHRQLIYHYRRSHRRASHAP